MDKNAKFRRQEMLAIGLEVKTPGLHRELDMRGRDDQLRKGKGKGKDKDKGKGKGKSCLHFNDKGCNYGSACKMLHEAPAMAACDDQTRPSPAPKAKAAAAPKAAAASDPAKP